MVEGAVHHLGDEQKPRVKGAFAEVLAGEPHIAFASPLLDDIERSLFRDDLRSCAKAMGRAAW